MLVKNLRLPALSRKGEYKWAIEKKDSCTPLPMRVVTTLKGLSQKKTILRFSINFSFTVAAIGFFPLPNTAPDSALHHKLTSII